MKRHHNHDHTHAQHAQCTCKWLTQRYATPDVGPDPDCPRHGLEAILELADQDLDIDTSYAREEG